MKTFFLSLVFLPFLSVCFAQPVDGVNIAGKPFSEIESSVISVRLRTMDNRFRVVGDAFQPLSVYINYGQPCMNPRRGASLNRLTECSMLLSAEGEILTFESYVLALDFVQRLGWELKGTISMGESSDQLSAVYLFSKS